MVVNLKPFFAPVPSGEVEVVSSLLAGEVSGATVSDVVVDSLELSVVVGSITSGTVSYTHLDVYKRQNLRSSGISMTRKQIWKSLMIHLWPTFWKKNCGNKS